MLKTMKTGFTLIELMIVVAIIGLLAAIAIPNFIKLQARSKQAEAKTILKTAFTTERAYYQEKGTFSPSIVAIGFLPERGNRYKYCFNSACATTGTDRTSADADAPVAATTDRAHERAQSGGVVLCLLGDRYRQHDVAEPDDALVDHVELQQGRGLRNRGFRRFQPDAAEANRKGARCLGCGGRADFSRSSWLLARNRLGRGQETDCAGEDP